MKKVYYSLLLLFIATTTLAQGIAIQGIARDNTNSAIKDTDLTFTFRITEDNNTVVYSETQAIKTDNFGVFSHIVSTGNPTTSAFNNVDFSITNLKMKVLVVYEGKVIEVYNQTFQYTPYSFFAQKAALATNATNADNGVPTGAVMPYTGTTAPEGWVLCNGQSLTSITGSAALRAIIGNNTPNLQGTFLRGTGVSNVNAKSGPALRSFQNDAFESHLHGSGTLATSTAGLHSHTYLFGAGSEAGISGGGWNNGEIGYRITTNNTTAQGNHTHTISGSVASTGDNETRPVNYGVNYIIKL
jgi:microcystin-dependent protein